MALIRSVDVGVVSPNAVMSQFLAASRGDSLPLIEPESSGVDTASSDAEATSSSSDSGASDVSSAVVDDESEPNVHIDVPIGGHRYVYRA